MHDRADHLVRGARVAVTGAAVLAVTLVVAACGGGSGGGTTATTAATTAATSAPATTSAAAASTTPNGAAGHSADQILADARTAAAAATSVRVAGSVPASGQTTTIDVRLAAGKGGAGTISVGNTKVDLIQIGHDVYLRGPKSLFQKTTGSSGVAQLLAGKWFKAPTTGTSAADFASLSAVLDMRRLLSSLLSPTGTITKGGTGAVDGVPTVVLKSSDGSLDVATVGPAYPMSVRQNGGSGRVTFTEWNTPVTLTPPPNALDFSTVTGG